MENKSNSQSAKPDAKPAVKSQGVEQKQKLSDVKDNRNITAEGPADNEELRENLASADSSLEKPSNQDR